MPTDIPYVDEVLNITSGCTPVGEGCLHCWAKRMRCVTSVPQRVCLTGSNSGGSGRQFTKCGLMSQASRANYGTISTQTLLSVESGKKPQVISLTASGGSRGQIHAD